MLTLTPPSSSLPQPTALDSISGRVYAGAGIPPLAGTPRTLLAAAAAAAAASAHGQPGSLTSRNRLFAGMSAPDDALALFDGNGALGCSPRDGGMSSQRVLPVLLPSDSTVERWTQLSSRGAAEARESSLQQQLSLVILESEEATQGVPQKESQR